MKPETSLIPTTMQVNIIVIITGKKKANACESCSISWTTIMVHGRDEEGYGGKPQSKFT